MTTIPQLQKAIKAAQDNIEFVEFWPSLEQQIYEWKEQTDKLWWKADVSNGCRQAFTPAATKIE